MTSAYQPTSDLVHTQVAHYGATDGREGGTRRRWRIPSPWRIWSGYWS
jgi:hypothetical protein